MSEKINPREVLAYLNELGYTNIDGIQLKEFLTDLKKLIKYEEEKLSRNNKSKVTGYDDSTINLQVLTEKNVDEVANRLYSQTTVSSKAKTVALREHVTTIQINRPKTVHSHHMNCVHYENNLPDQIRSTKPLKEQNILNEPPTKDVDEGKRKPKKKPELSKPKGFIRPQISTNVKSDPVALYHQYQSEWKKWKVLGDDRRSDLRWHIRDKMSARI